MAHLYREALVVLKPTSASIAARKEIIAAILERPVIERILTHLGLDPQPPPRGRVRKVVQDRSRRA